MKNMAFKMAKYNLGKISMVRGIIVKYYLRNTQKTLDSIPGDTRTPDTRPALKELVRQ